MLATIPMLCPVCCLGKSDALSLAIHNERASRGERTYFGVTQ